MRVFWGSFGGGVNLFFIFVFIISAVMKKLSVLSAVVFYLIICDYGESSCIKFGGGIFYDEDISQLSTSNRKPYTELSSISNSHTFPRGV